MRKLLATIVILLFSLIIVACDEISVISDALLEKVEIGYEVGDSSDYVTADVTLPSSIEGEDGVTLTWTSSNSDYLTISSNTGVVHRQPTNVEVTLTVEVKKGQIYRNLYFELTIIQLTSDTVGPEIFGARDITYVIGEDLPNFLDGVSALDDVDGSVLVTVDSSQVNLETTGTYDLVYTAGDKSGNKTIVTVTVTVVLDAQVEDTTEPVISGTKDIHYTIGDPAPNYLSGVSALDDVDGLVTVEVDDSNVDLQTVGTYDLAYVAIDLAGNTSEVVVQVFVSSAAGTETAETYVETFNNFIETGSGYVDGSFTGVNGVNWTYQGARGDIVFNGNSMTFGGRNDDESFLKATISGGIAEISLNYKKPFSNSQDYGVYINDQLMGTFNAQNSDGSFKHTLVTPIVGSFTLEIKPVTSDTVRKQITIDDLTWVSVPANQKPVEQINAEYDRDHLSVVTAFIENGNLTLPITGVKGSSISWDFESEDANNSLINLSTGAVTVPGTGQVKVSLVATISNATFTYEKVFLVTLGEGDPLPINTIRNEGNGSFVKTVGVITSIYRNQNTTFFFIEDVSGAVMVEASNSQTVGFVVGDEIEIKASKNTVNSNVVLNAVRLITKLGTKTITPKVVTSNQLASNPGKLVSVFGLISKNYSAQTTSFVLYTQQGEFTILIPSDLDATQKALIQQKLTNLDPGTKVTVFAPVYRVNTQYFLLVTKPDELVVENSVDFNEVSSLILSNFIQPTIPQIISENLDLTLENPLRFGATISWVSSNPSALTSAGVITKTDNDVTVNLTYTITFDGEVVETKTFVVTVQQISSYTGYYQSLSGKSGSALKTALTNLIKNTGRATGETNEVKTVDSFNGQNYNIYTGFGPYGNREHVWPNSKLGSAPKYDLHNLRAAVTSVNSTRGNHPFTNAISQVSWQLVNKNSFYPGQEHVGDVARIVLYISVRYGLNLNLVGNLNMFLTWHVEDEVSAFELSRNSKIESIQNNRNPFIDHPELVDVMFS